MQPNTALPAVHASLLLTTLSSLPFSSHIKKVSVGPLLKTNQWLIFRLIFMFVKVSQTITKYVLTVYVVQITGMGAAPAAHGGNYGSRTTGGNYTHKHEQGHANTNQHM